MKRVKGVEDLNICIIGAQGIVGVGAIIPMSTESCRAAGSRLTASAGSRAVPASSYPSPCSRDCSGGCSSKACRRHSRPASCNSFRHWNTLRDPVAFRRYLDPARRINWVVYAKPPFGGPEQVLDYVGRYTHRVAIANNRISTSRMARYASDGRTIATAAGKS